MSTYKTKEEAQRAIDIAQAYSDTKYEPIELKGKYRRLIKPKTKHRKEIMCVNPMSMGGNKMLMPEGTKYYAEWEE